MSARSWPRRADLELHTVAFDHTEISSCAGQFHPNPSEKCSQTPSSGRPTNSGTYSRNLRLPVRRLRLPEYGSNSSTSPFCGLATFSSSLVRDAMDDIAVKCSTRTSSDSPTAPGPVAPLPQRGIDTPNKIGNRSGRQCPCGAISRDLASVHLVHRAGLLLRQQRAAVRRAVGRVDWPIVGQGVPVGSDLPGPRFALRPAVRPAARSR
jgi:hypothetical protein